MTEGIITINIQKKILLRLEKWKEKAIARGKKVNKLKKQLLELRESRDKWKEKFKAERLKSERYKKSIEENKTSEIVKEPVKNHSYDLFTISLCLSLKEAGELSLRSCISVLKIIVEVLGVPLKIPCINSIRNWELKKGLYNLENVCKTGDEYALIIDESYCIGQQTLLLLLGVNLSSYEFEKGINFSNAEVLGLAVQPSWKGEEIALEIEQIQNRSYTIAYCCSDGGGNIAKALRIKDIERVPDCTHYLSKIIEKEYKNAEIFKSFTSQCALINRQNYMGKDTGICPPKLKGKSRFLNLYTLAKWGLKNLTLVQKLASSTCTNLQQRIYDKLKWLNGYQSLIETLNILVKKIEAISKIIKQKGLSKATIAKVKKMIKEKDTPLFFKQGVATYLEEAGQLLSKQEKLICCSDIIESHFGKFKNQQKKNPDKGITINCLRIANYGKPMEKEELSKAMQQIKIVDLEKWKDDNNLETFVARKKKLYKSVG